MQREWHFLIMLSDGSRTYPGVASVRHVVEPSTWYLPAEHGVEQTLDEIAEEKSSKLQLLHCELHIITLITL